MLYHKANIIGLDVNGMYAVTCGYQFSPGYRNVSIAVACRYDFQGHICQNWVIVNLYNVQGTCTETFGSQGITGYRNVSKPNTYPYDFQRYVFPKKANIFGLDLNGMYAVTCDMQRYLGINSSLDIVTSALDSPPLMISRAIFARIR